MELRHLRYFVTVAEELHFGRAAQKLHISQPPLSMQIRALEKELGVTLLNRTQRHVSLTQAGAALLGEARHILARVEQAVLMTKRAGRGEIGELAIGFISVADYNVLPVVLREPLIAALPEKHPLARRPGKLALEELEDAPFILFPRSNAPGLYDDVVSCCKLAWRRGDDLPALRVFVDVALQTAKAANTPQKGQKGRSTR
jgi:DNA-binding transcriptional LysR family regulator